MSRYGEGVWLEDIDANKLQAIRRRVETRGFWEYVDSQSSAYSHPGECETRSSGWFGSRVICSDWRHRRGDGCIAANSDLVQCRQATVAGLPFCGFHLDRAWLAMCAFVARDREVSAKREAETRRYFELKAVGLDVAQVEDARRVLAAQPERVYFYAAGHAVKVGRSRNPEQRVKTLGATLAPDDVDVAAGTLLGTIPGGASVEHSLHMHFRPHRLVGEWFELEPIREAIDGLLADPQLADTA